MLYLRVDGKGVWKSILTGNFEHYQNKTAISQITIYKPSFLRRSRKINDNKPLDKQIKSFNFMFIGNEVIGISHLKLGTFLVFCIIHYNYIS
jgi:hypothetical protein